MSVARGGTWLLGAASLAALLISLYDDFGPYNGINGTEGALLVVISSALMLIAVLLLLYARPGHGLRVTLDVLIFLDIVGTGFAAYMLEADLLLVAMAVALLGWLIRVFGSPRRVGPIRLEASP